MPRMNSPDLPRCCAPLVDHWPLPLALDGVRLLSTRFDPLLFEPEDFARCQVPPVRGVAKRQSEFLAGRLCAREGLRRLTGLAQVPAVGAERAPVWPVGTVGSITHGGGWAAAVVGQDALWRGLGLDVETLIPSERADRLAGEILTANEHAIYAQLDARQRSERLTQAFSLKESLFKALYPLVRTRFYFQDAELVESDPGLARLRLLIDLPGWPRGSELAGQFCEFDGYLLSLVSVPASAQD
ncbi:4'-phosphopantetheinyl transferase family protein [Pseudomonas oligotrophica]|uniref:4'-phosphopantetheinyl transferase family protein n=1 Tax=Pseudomonas oligotrophica TaxID=2912055 RepID=UPI003D707A5A